jgi:hypothetical protein
MARLGIIEIARFNNKIANLFGDFIYNTGFE